jgi:hypothetical protein
MVISMDGSGGGGGLGKTYLDEEERRIQRARNGRLPFMEFSGENYSAPMPAGSRNHVTVKQPFALQFEISTEY